MQMAERVILTFSAFSMIINNRGCAYFETEDYALTKWKIRYIISSSIHIILNYINQYIGNRRQITILKDICLF